MDIEATKLELINLLLQTRKEALLLKIKNLFEEEQTDWWYEMSKEEQLEIEKGVQQANNGEFISNDHAMKRFKK